ncbi:hypothetical protein [Erythrobacter rubeus]|uniref:Helix-turn-helix domain-containing protein n=1 Tax=Erythrobacter rubeus TaxID=2760803 RepID=A0ABR8KWV3_9SPHN|nr:hypothetical protein [Erythrobacter rubeus]MBD2842697.1 hypothetical protein [Erythrobacter rubeus]
MAEENLETDLFGDPVFPPREARGRPEFQWTLERSNRVLLAFARGLSLGQTAKLIDCDVKTLKKHFSREVGLRQTASLRLEMRQLERLNAQADAGNVTAEKELAKRIEVLRVRDHMLRSDVKPAKAKQPKRGKKEQRVHDARYAAAGDPEWRDLGLIPPAGHG